MLKRIRRFWAAISQPGTGGLIQPGDWRVLYHEGGKTYWMSHGDAQNLANIFGGVLQWKGDLD